MLTYSLVIFLPSMLLSLLSRVIRILVLGSKESATTADRAYAAHYVALVSTPAFHFQAVIKGYSRISVVIKLVVSCYIYHIVVA